ncbi:MAG: urease accessory protein UreD [Pseudomonadota bacterium]
MRHTAGLAVDKEASLAGKGWRAELDLAFGKTKEGTTLLRRSHCGPLRVQRPFYPEGGDVCHVYLLHPPGGVVAGDELDVGVTLDKGAHALITTPAANKFYRSNGAWARLRQSLQVARGASLEWFPQEAILFDGARADVRTRVELAGDASFMGWEITCLGRPAAHEKYLHGESRQCFEIWRDGRPLWLERASFAGDGTALSAAWGMAGHTVTGTFACVTRCHEVLPKVRAVAESCRDGGVFNATQLEDVLVCRYLGDHAEDARRYFILVWETLRPLVMQRPACAPRIWAT